MCYQKRVLDCRNLVALEQFIASYSQSEMYNSKEATVLGMIVAVDVTEPNTVCALI